MWLRAKIIDVNLLMTNIESHSFWEVTLLMGSCGGGWDNKAMV